MSDNLWYIYDYDNVSCDECYRPASCAIWRKGDTDQFIAVCGYCDQDWRLTNGE